MTNEDDEIKKLDIKTSIELKRYEWLDKHFLETKNRRLLLVSAEVAIFVYLFSDLQNMIPGELYGIIFFGMGIASAIASLVASFYHLRPIRWFYPIGATEKAEIDASKSELEWKKIVYTDCHKTNLECIKVLNSIARSLKLSLTFFVISVTILVIIKFF